MTDAITAAEFTAAEGTGGWRVLRTSAVARFATGSFGAGWVSGTKRLSEPAQATVSIKNRLANSFTGSSIERSAYPHRSAARV